MTEELHDRLIAAVPAPPPGAGEWAETARTASRRRRTRSMTVGVLAAVAVAGIGVQAYQHTRTHWATALPAAAPGAGCDSLGALQDPETSAALRVPDGVVGVRLCAWPGSGAGLSVDIPRDELVQGAADVASRFNGAHPVGLTRACPAVGGMSYVMVFRTSDGHRAAVPADLGGCGDVGGREGAKALLDDFVARLTAQRRTLPPPTVPASDPCTGSQTSLMPVSPSQLSSGAICLPQGHPRLSEPLLAQLAADIRANRARRGQLQVTETVMLRDVYGQPLWVNWHGDQAMVGWQDRVVQLSSGTAAGLARLAGQVSAPVSRQLCQNPSSTKGLEMGGADRGALCTATPRPLEGQTAGSISKLIYLEGRPATSMPTGGVPVVIADGAGHRIRLVWTGATLTWKDPKSGAVRRLALEDWILAQLKAAS